MSGVADGRVISANVACRKGVQKEPREAVVLIAGHGVEADAHAGPWHRQVSLLADESVQRMRALGAHVSAGSFGENLTTEGLAVCHLPIGTRLHIVPAVVEVTQIGKECHDHCAIYASVGDCVMPREGVFARVLVGGEVRPGDEISIEKPSLIRAAVLTVSDNGAAGEREDVDMRWPCQVRGSHGSLDLEARGASGRAHGIGNRPC